MKFGNFEIPPKKEELNDFISDDTSLDSKDKFSISNKDEKFIKIPLSEDEKSLSAKEISQKYNLSLKGGYFVKERGYRSIENTNYIKKKDIKNENKEFILNFFKEITPLEINSINNILGNIEDQQKISKMLEVYDKYKTANRFIPSDIVSGKKFILLNGQELTFGDLVVLDKIVKLKMFRNSEGKLMIFDNKKNNFIIFNPSKFWGNNQSFTFKEVIGKDKNNWHSVENFSPHIFNLGIFKEEDFNKRAIGTNQYEMYGPHERKLSPTSPYVFLSNEETSAKYYIGREKFNGTNKKINHDTVRVSLLDNNTGVVIDTINGKKTILYIFPLITKEEFDKQKENILKRRELENKSLNINFNEYITKKADLKEYLITDYIQKNKQESDVEYADRISKLSDTSYVLGNFRSFISETGLAANNYSWKDQLTLSDTLTSVIGKDKIVNFGRNFKKDGMRTFLSVEQGGKEMGNKILMIGEKLPEDVAEKVFAKYGEIIDVADKAEEEVRKLYEKDNIPNEVFISIKEILLKRGANLLSQLADGLDSDKQVEEIEILKMLEDIKTSTIIMGESYIELYKQGVKVPIEEIKDTTLEKIEANNLSEKEKQELVKVYENGRPKETYENKEHLKLLTEEFKQTLENKDTFVFNIRLGGELIAFATFYKENEDTLHIGGLTFIDDVRNPVVGEAVMNSIMREFSNFNIKALVHSENKILKMYQKRFGFKITKELPREENAGELYYEIEREKNNSKEKVIGNNLNRAA